MNIIYSQFSDIGEYFKDVNQKDFSTPSFLGSIGGYWKAVGEKAGDITASKMDSVVRSLDKGVNAVKDAGTRALDVTTGAIIGAPIAVHEGLKDAVVEPAGRALNQATTNVQYNTNILKGMTPIEAMRNTDAGRVAESIAKTYTPKATPEVPSIDRSVPSSSYTWNPTPDIKVPDATKFGTLVDQTAKASREGLSFGKDLPEVEGDPWMGTIDRLGRTINHGVNYNPEKWAGKMKGLYDEAGRFTADKNVAEMVREKMPVWRAQNEHYDVDPALNTSHPVTPMSPLPEEAIKSPFGVFMDKMKDTGASIKEGAHNLADLNNDGLVSPLEAGSLGAASALILGLGVKALHEHKKTKRMKNAVKQYANRYPNSKLAKAAGFSEKDSNRVLKAMAGALGGGALGYIAGIPLDDAGFYDAAGVAPFVGGALGASKILAADAKRADSGELVNKKIQELKSRLPEETYSKKLDKITKKYTDDYGFTPEIGSIKDSFMKKEELGALKKAVKSEKRKSPEYIKQKEERKNSAKALAKTAGIGAGIGAGVGAGGWTLYDAIEYGYVFPEEVAAVGLLGSALGTVIGAASGAIKQSTKRRKSLNEQER